MKLGLNQKIIVAGIMVITIFMLMFWFSNKLIFQLTEDIEESNDLSQLHQLTVLMTDTATQYDQNAPRDYESYNRDVKVYYGRLKDYLSTLADSIEKAEDDYYNRSTFGNILLDGGLIEQNDNNFKQLPVLHQQFIAGFNEKLGDNEEEPRLEWGNDYILADESGLFAHIAQTDTQFQDLVVAHRSATQQFNKYVSLALIVVLLLLILWFNQSIVKRIIKVAKGCRQVAEGDFGFQIQDKGSDEINQLVQDFNQLSSRSKSILSMLGALQTVHSRQEALDVIRKETQLMINSTALLLVRPNGSVQTIEHISPDSQNQEGLGGKQLAADDSCLQWNDGADFLHIGDVLSHTVKFKNAHLAKYLLHNMNVNSLLALSISNKDDNGILIFAKKQKKGFNQQQINTLQSLSSLFATALLSD